jgi:hypothetical protein
VAVKLENWIFTVNPTLIERLKKEMVELIQYVEKLGVRLQFYPENIGVSEDMSLRYFIGHFDPF